MPAKEVGRSIYPVLLDREYLTVCLNIWIHAGAARRVCSARSVHFVPKLPRSQTIANCSKTLQNPGFNRVQSLYIWKKKTSLIKFQGDRAKVSELTWTNCFPVFWFKRYCERWDLSRFICLSGIMLQTNCEPALLPFAFDAPIRRTT